MSSLIRLRGVVKAYDRIDQPALAGVDLAFERGSITAVTGPSGCGKSTLLNLIGGLDRPTEGEVTVDDVRVDLLSESDAARFRRARVGFIFQFFHLLDDLTIRDNIAIAALIAGRPRSAAIHEADRLLSELGLASASGRYPGSLSGGERQRLAVGRAVVNGPAVLLADEPTGALDRRNGELTLALLDDLHRRGQTIILVTHDDRLAEQRADRIVRLVDGRVVADGATRMAA